MARKEICNKKGRVKTLPFLLLCLMHGELWEWERNTLFVERSVYVLVHVKVHTPIVGSIHPYADGDVYATICQGAQFNKRSRIFQDAAVFVDYLHNDRFGLVEVCTVFNTE